MFDPYEWEAIDWDDPDDEAGNLVHCLRHGVDEMVVDEVLRQRPVSSFKRGDWLRPMTGWEAKPNEIRQWEKITHQTWRGRNG